MSWPPLQTLFVIIVTSVAANHHGANCDCASQGPWQPLFKPSQILHSEFPEHQHSSSTGGPKPTKIRHYKLVPHIVVPLVNPVALTIHHENDNHIHDDEKYKYKKGNYGKHKIKEIHYHYNFPDPNDPSPTKYNEPSPTPTPTDGNYVNTNNNYPEEEGNQQSFPDEGTHDPHTQNEDAHHSQEDEGYNYGVNPTEGYNYGANPTEGYNYGANPTEDGTPGHSYETTTHEQHYSNEEQPTYNPYYGSGEQNDAVYDASKLSPGYELKPSEYPVYQNPQQENMKQYTSYYHPNKLDVRGKSRGKSIYIPIYRINQPSNMIKHPENHRLPFKVQETSTTKPMPLILPTNPTSFHSNHHNLPPNFMKNHLHHRIPLHPLPLVHPPFSFYNPWRFLMKDDARRMILMRPPAPGLPDTWTTTQTNPDNHAQVNVPSKVKMTGVIYPLKNFQI